MTHDINTITVPNTLGIIVDKHKGERTPSLTIFLLKTVVGDAAGKQRVRQLLRYLHDSYRLDTIYTDTIQSKPNASENQILEALGTGLSQDTLPELLSLSKELNVTVFGVESTELHLREQNFFRSIRKQSDDFGWVFAEIETQLAALRQRYFSPELLDFEKKLTNFNDGSLKLDDLLRLLDSLANQSMVSWNDYPTLQLMIAGVELPKADNNQINQEIRQLAADLIKNFSAKDVFYFEQMRPSAILMTQRAGHTLQEAIEIIDAASANQKTSLYLEFRTQATKIILAALIILSKGGTIPHEAQEITTELERFSGLKLKEIDHGSLLDLLIDTSTFCNIDLVNYPNVVAGAHALHHQNAIRANWSLVAPEIENFRINGRSALAKTRESVEMLRIQYHLEEMRQLLQLQLLPDEKHSAMNRAEYEVFRSDLTLEKFLGYELFLGGCGQAILIRLRDAQTKFDTLIREALQYYETARDRSAAIIQNMLAHMGEHGLREAVLVITGYLEPYILDQLRQGQFSYVSINPKLDDPLGLAKTHLDSLEFGFGNGLPQGQSSPNAKQQMAYLQDAPTIRAMTLEIQQNNWRKAIEIGEAYCLERPAGPGPLELFIPDPLNLRLKNHNPMLLYYLAASHLQLKQLERATLYVVEARNNCHETEVELKGQIDSLYTQLKQIEEKQKEAALVKFIQSLELHIKKEKWDVVVKEIDSYCTSQYYKRSNEFFPGILRSGGLSQVSIPPLDEVHPIILFYLAVGYSRIQQPGASKHVAEFAIRQCGSEHENLRSQLEQLIFQVGLQKFSDVLEELQSGAWWAPITLSQRVESDPKNAYAYYARILCNQQQINATLDLGHPGPKQISALREPCEQISQDLKSARQYAAASDTFLLKQLDQVESNYRHGICGQIG